MYYSDFNIDFREVLKDEIEKVDINREYTFLAIQSQYDREDGVELKEVLSEFMFDYEDNYDLLEA